MTAGKFAATDLVIVLAGANDVFTQAGLAGAGAITSQAAGQAVGVAAGELLTQIARLKAAGAKHLLVLGLPDMGITPTGVAQGAAAAAALTQLSQSVFNATLTAGLANVPGVSHAFHAAAARTTAKTPAATTACRLGLLDSVWAMIRAYATDPWLAATGPAGDTPCMRGLMGSFAIPIENQ